MEWKMPPRIGKYKLVVTEKFDNDILLIVLCPEPRNYTWSEVQSMPDCEIKDYFMSLKDDIEAGAFEYDLLQIERTAEEKAAAVEED